MADGFVFVLLDDTSPNIPLSYMAELITLAAGGVNFTNHIISSPVCSPSRASIMTGQHCHNTGMFGNDYPGGGYGVFGSIEGTGWQVPIQAASRYTSFIGKYQNHYEPEGNADPDEGFIYGLNHVPTGWNDWLGFDGLGYREWGWQAVQKIGAAAATTVSVGSDHDETDYATDYMSDWACASIARAAAAGKQVAMMVSPFGTHSGGAATDPQKLQYPPAPRHRKVASGADPSWDPPNFTNGDCGPGGATSCAAVPWPDPGPYTGPDLSWNTLVENRLAWHPNAPLTDDQNDKNKDKHLNRIRMAQSIDELIAAVRAQLVTSGLAATTWIFVMSDNGFHMGERAMNGGKGRPYDQDSRLTLVAYPPGGTTGRDEAAVVQNVDMYNTFLDICGVAQDTTRDGRSLKGFVTGSPPSPWRQTALIQFDTDGPSFDDKSGTGQAPSHRSLRDVHYLYAHYGDVQDPKFAAGTAGTSIDTELYVLDTDPWQTTNEFGRVQLVDRDALAALSLDYRSASGAALWTIGLDPIPTIVLGAQIIDEVSEGHLVMDDMEFHEPNGRWWMDAASGLPQLASKDVPLTKIPEIPGLQLSGQATQRESYWPVTLFVTDKNADGEHGGEAELEENIQDVYLVIGPRKLVTVGYSFGGPVRWEFKGRVPGAVVPKRLAQIEPLVALPIEWLVPAGVRRGLNYLVWSRTLTADLNNEIIDLIQDTTAPIVDALFRYTGPFTMIDSTDVFSDSGFRIQHPDEKATPGTRNIAEDEYVIVDVERHRAFLAEIPIDGVLSWDTSGMTDISAGLDSYGSGQVPYPITPEAGGGGPGVGPDPRNRIAKIDCVVTYPAVRAGTAIDIRFKQARP